MIEDNVGIIVVAVLSLAALFAGSWMLDLVAWTLVLVGAAGLSLVARHIATRRASRMPRSVDLAALTGQGTLNRE